MSNLAQRQAQLLDWINHSTPFLCQQLEMVYGDASFRRYFRFTYQNQSIIAVDAPPMFEDSQKFVLIAELYAKNGLSVPRVLAHDQSQGFYCLQDFGDRLFSAALDQTSCQHLYPQALGLLPSIQLCTRTSQANLPEFDDNLLTAEFEIFTHWLLSVHLKLTLSAQELRIVTQIFACLRANFFAQPQVGVHRDFHSRNLMLLDDGNIGVIDFQDAVLGPITYDAVSLLRDCYQRWPSEWVDQWFVNWHTQYYGQYPFKQFKRWFDLSGLQRHIKASGIFARLYHRDAKVDYLADIPRTLGYLCEIGQQYSECQAFAQLITDKIIPRLTEVQEKMSSQSIEPQPENIAGLNPSNAINSGDCNGN
ncbi:MAG: aminoglycoside/choline kinase family phosphotransferase [Paraglaciecola sp.]